VHVAKDPLFSRYPIRGFPADVALAGAPRLTLAALAEAVAPLVGAAAAGVRRSRWHAEHARLRTAWIARAQAVSRDRPIDMAHLSKCVGDALDDRTVVVNEYDLDPTQTCFTAPGAIFNASPSAGLGWGLGAALGVKLAEPAKTVICCVGDGAYIFGAPTAAHFVSRAYDLPVLFVVFNNQAWNAVKRAVQDHAPAGWSGGTASMPLTYLDPAPDYELVCRASGGYAERVEDPAEVPAALARALRVTREEQRQALLNVICKKP
jgi:acetolactate synthase-1/2/3 large subunit